MPNKINKLTKKQIALQDTKRDEWINVALYNKNFDKEELEAGVKWLYYVSNLKEPEVVFVDGPKDFTEKLVPKTVLEKLRASVGDSVGASVGDSVGASVGDKVWASVRDSVWASVGASVWASVMASVRDSVRASVSGCTLTYDADFGAWYEYYKEIKAIPAQEKADKYVGYLRAGAFYAMFFEKKAFIMCRPVQVEQDERKRLHSTTGPALIFADGTEIYQIHGVRFTKEQFKKSKKATVKDLLGWDDIEQRSVLLSDKPLEQMLKEAKAKIIDETDELGGYKLWEIDLGLRSKAKAMTYKGWSKGADGNPKQYAKYVPNNSTNCLETIASLRGLTIEEFKLAIKS